MKWSHWAAWQCAIAHTLIILPVVGTLTFTGPALLKSAAVRGAVQGVDNALIERVLHIMGPFFRRFRRFRRFFTLSCRFCGRFAVASVWLAAVRCLSLSICLRR